jgi:hypothetical protein
VDADAEDRLRHRRDARAALRHDTAVARQLLRPRPRGGGGAARFPHRLGEPAGRVPHHPLEPRRVDRRVEVRERLPLPDLGRPALPRRPAGHAGSQLDPGHRAPPARHRQRGADRDALRRRQPAGAHPDRRDLLRDRRDPGRSLPGHDHQHAAAAAPGAAAGRLVRRRAPLQPPPGARLGASHEPRPLERLGPAVRARQPVAEPHLPGVRADRLRHPAVRQRRGLRRHHQPDRAAQPAVRL